MYRCTYAKSVDHAKQKANVTLNSAELKLKTMPEKVEKLIVSTRDTINEIFIEQEKQFLKSRKGLLNCDATDVS